MMSGPLDRVILGQRFSIHLTGTVRQIISV
jgi:hypothetical protein